MTREDAIEEIKCWDLTPGERDVLEALIPELAETEDERIRKELIEMVNNLCNGNGVAYLLSIQKRDEYLAWLEKQKEQRPYEPQNWPADKDNLTQGQKPAEKQDYSGLNDLERAIHRGFLAASVENVSVTIIKETAQECLAQMKTAEWSEGKYPKDITADVTQYCFDNGINITPNQAKQIATHYLMIGYNTGYIEGRKNAHIPAKELGLPSSMDYKQEWSEEDEEMIKTLVDFYDSFDEDESFHNTTYGGIANWLKSLRPPKNWKEGWCDDCKVRYNHWKPSEEHEEPEYYQHFDPDC